MAKKLIIEVVGDSKSYERALKRSATATSQFGQALGTTSPKLGKLSTGMALAGTSSLFLAGAAGGLAVALGTKSVQAASDLNEEISKSQQIFAGSAKEIKDWSTTTAESMGISQTEALRATGTFGALFKTLAFGEKQNADLSKSLVQLAADMASFNNADPSEVLLALRSGLTGEAEPLRRFGVFLSEARTQQLALIQTGKTSIKQLTNQEKVFARLTIIMKDTTSAQGDFERTSGSLANQQRVLRAQVTELEAGLGTLLLPAITGVVGALNDAISAGQDLKNVLGLLADLPGIEIPVKLVTEVTGGGRFAKFLQYRLLGNISPLALGINIGKEIVDGIRQGSEGALGTAALPGPGETAVSAGEESRGRARTRQRNAAGNAVIAQITKQATAERSLNQELADSEKRAAHLRDLIRADPDNARLQRRLTAELKKQNDLRKEQSDLNKQNAADARAAAEAAKQQAKAEAVARRERKRERAETRREQEKARQFKALGLTAEGLKPTPGSGSLLKRALSMQERLRGTALDTKKNRSQLRTIVEFLRKNFKKAGKDVREAILGMLNDIAGAGDAAKQGPLTKGSGLKVGKILEGMGLSPEEVRELRARLSHVSSGGKVLAQGAGTRARGGVGFGDNPPIIVESHVYIDGREVTTTVTKQQQKDKRRNPRQKRGPNRIGGV